MQRKRIFLFISVLVFCFYFPLAVFAQRIVVFGDSQGEEGHRQVVKAVERFKPTIIFRVGDLVDDGDDPAQWKLFNEIESGLLKSTEYFPALGNHEKNSPLYFKNFNPSQKSPGFNPGMNGIVISAQEGAPDFRPGGSTIPQNGHWYSVDREGIHFIILDSNSEFKPESEQYQWLLSDLRALPESCRFRVVLFHHPLFSASKVHGDDEKHIGSLLLPLLKEYGVDLVLNGHVHCYQRFFFDGINFITTGGGGSPLVDADRPNPYLRFSAKLYQFCTLEVKGDVLQVRCYDLELNVIDELNIQSARMPQAALETAP